MKISELKKLLKAGEWNDVEFKEGRTAVPKSAFETVSRDGIQLWNPGDVFGDDSRLFEPGEKEVRNPAIAMAMRRIAMCEQAGTGMRMMREEWRKLGHPAPTYKNDRAWKAFEFFIPELDKEVDMASDLMKAMFTDTDQVRRLLDVLHKEELNAVSMMARLRLSHRPTFRLNYLHPALEAGFVEMTIPDKPRSSKQKYRLTEKGRHVLAEIEGGGN